MKYLHTMVRVTNVEASLKFYRDALGMDVLSHKDNEAGRYTLVFLAAPGDHSAQIELTYNWPAADGTAETYGGGRNFGHVAYAVPDIYATCQRLVDHGVTVLRPHTPGRFIFASPHSGTVYPSGMGADPSLEDASLRSAEPWKSMPNTGSW